MKKYLIVDNFHEKDLYICIGDYEAFCIEMEKLDCDTLERGNPLAMYIYVDGKWGYIRLWQAKIERLIHELTHYTRDIGEKIWYTDEPLHEYYAYAMEFYVKEAKKKIKGLKL